MATYEVIVGNVGTVYHGESEADANKTFDEYSEIVKNSENWWSHGEPVTLIEDNEIVREVVPPGPEHGEPVG
jgi:hypothetical protein